MYEKRGYLEDEFRVFYLSDKIEQEVQFHYHDFDKIIIFLSGNVNYTIEGRSYDLRPYDVILVNHGEVHRLKVMDQSAYERMIIYISPSYLSHIRGKNDRLDTCFLKAKEEHSNVLRISSLDKSILYQTAVSLREALSKQEEFAGDLYKELLFLQFMVHLNRAAIGEGIEYLTTKTCNKRIVDIMEYINQNLTQEQSIDQISEKFFISKYHMMRLFKQETGYTMGNYISNKRLLLARELLRQGHSVTQACYDSGFHDHSNFSRAYLKAFGVLPGSELKNKK